jgi:hypothetical protein
MWRIVYVQQYGGTACFTEQWLSAETTGVSLQRVLNKMAVKSSAGRAPKAE